MKVVFTRFPLESAYGGAEVQVLSLMKGLMERGHTVHFLGSCPVLLEHAPNIGIEVTPLSIGHPPVTKPGAISFLWRRFAMCKKLQSAMDQFHTADVVIMLSLSEKLLLTPLLSARGVQCYWLEHDLVGRWLQWNPWLPRLRRLSRSVKTIVVSRLSKMMYVDMGWREGDLEVVPNGVDSDRFQRSAERISQYPNIRISEHSQGMKVGCVARLTQDKGVDLLIRAITDVPNAVLSIIGTGPERSSLEQLACDVGIADRVTFEDRSKDLGVFYSSLDCLVLPSRQHDPFGLVAAEAMMLGVPVIVTDACGIADFLTDGDTVLIARAGSKESLSEKLEAMQDHALRERIAEHGNSAAMSTFSLEEMVNRYEALLTTSS